MRGLKKTGITNLWRSESGIYYLVIKLDGKRVKRSLRTSSREIARELLPDRLKAEKARARRKAGFLSFGESSPGKGTWSEVLSAWLQYQTTRPDLQPRTKDYYSNMVAYALAALTPEQLITKATRRELEQWWSLIARRYAESTANNILSALRGALKLAADSGLDVPRGLLGGCRKLKPPPNELVVPSNAELEEILLSVESQGLRSSQESRDFIEFLAFVGCRIGEAREVTWGDLKNDEILIRGKKDAKGRSRTKGRDFRRVPIAKRIARLLDRRRPAGARSQDHLFGIQTPKRALEGACSRLKLPHLRIHDLRHFFATHCIERGVDLPTVAAWLGHKDGGVLAMRLYGHIRNQHSQEMGKRIG